MKGKNRLCGESGRNGLLPSPITSRSFVGGRIYQLRARGLRSRGFSQTLGEYLKGEREARNVSLEELSHATRINRPFLEALERNDFNFFSRKEFVLGFLRRYARFLSLDEQEILRRFTIETELAGRNEKFEQIPLFAGAPPAAEKAGEGEGEVPEMPLRTGLTGRRKVWLQIITLGIALGLTLYLNQLIKGREKLEERKQAEEAGKKKEKELGRDLPSDPNRLSESDPVEKKVLNREGPAPVRARAR